jgi:hypothetical protein
VPWTRFSAFPCGLSCAEFRADCALECAPAKDETIFTFTTQIFFAEETNTAVLATSPYNQRPERATTNATDSIFLSELIAKTDGEPERGLSAAFGIRLREPPPLEARGETAP